MVAKYEAISREIRRSIEDGSLKPGDKWPTVVELCTLYSVSKITVKRAIELLVEQGFITSRRGSGIFVKEGAAITQQAFLSGRNDRAKGFTFEHQGQHISSVVYDFSIIVPERTIATQLGIHADDFTYYIERVRQIDEKPIVIEYTYMPLDLIPGLKKKHLYGSIYQFIRDECGLKISSFHRTIRACGASEEEAKRLDTHVNEPLLELEQIGFLDSGRAFEYSVSRNVGNRYELHNVTLA